MKALSFSLFGALALSLVGCGEPVGVDEVQPVTEDIVDAMTDLPVLSREVSVEFEAAGIVAFELIDEAGYANFVASILSQDPEGCISATATNATVDVTWACAEITGTSQIAVALAGDTITFTNVADNLQIGNATVSYQNTFVVESLANNGALTKNTSILKGDKTIDALFPASRVDFITETGQLSFDVELEVTINDQPDTHSWFGVDVARGAKAPLAGEVTPESAFSSFSGGFLAEFSESNGAFFIRSHNAFFGIGVEEFDIGFQIDTENNNTLLPLLED